MTTYEPAAELRYAALVMFTMLQFLLSLRSTTTLQTHLLPSSGDKELVFIDESSLQYIQYT